MILHTETLKSWGGEQNKILNELKIHKNSGCTPILVCNPKSQIANRAKKEGIEVIELEMNKKNYHKTIPFIKRVIEQRDIKVVISHGSTDSWIVAIAGNLAKNRPILFRERHNLYPVNGWLSKWQHRKLFDAILVISKAVKEYMTSIGVDENRCKYLPSVVDIKHFETTKALLRDEFNIPKEHIVLGIFTSLREVKGVFEFAEVAKRVLKRYHNITVVFGGNYSKSAYEKIYQEYIDNNIDTNRVIWTGFRDDSATIMKDFDIFLFPSHSEGLGTVILEAMASSLPIVVYDIAPMNQLVSDGINGFCVPYKSIDKLTKRVEELINDNNKRVKFAKNSKEYVSKNYRYEVLEESINKLFKEYNVCT